jgi:hypothetical protein
MIRPLAALPPVEIPPRAPGALIDYAGRAYHFFE